MSGAEWVRWVVDLSRGAVSWPRTMSLRLGVRLALPVNALPLNVPAGSMVVSPHPLGSSEVVMGIGMSYILMAMR